MIPRVIAFCHHQACTGVGVHRLAVVMLLLVLLLGSGSAGAAGGEDPFHRSQSQTLERTPLQSAIGALEAAQARLKTELTRLTRSFKEGPRPALVLTLLALSFGYGVLHAAGPGHGKVVVLAFVLGGRYRPRTAAAIGAGAAFLHGMSAVLLVLGLVVLSGGGITAAFQAASARLVILSYSLITLIGLVLLIARLRRRDAAPETQAAPGRGSAVGIVLSLGLVPCPSSMIVLLFFLSQQLLPLGLLMALTMSVGMALTLALCGLFATALRAGAGGHAPGGRRPARVRALELSGPLGVMLLGIVLLVSAL